MSEELETNSRFNAAMMDAAIRLGGPDYDSVVEFKGLMNEGRVEHAAKFLDQQDIVVREVVVQTLIDAKFDRIVKVLLDRNGWELR
jgi:hypothetical protein